MYTPDEILLIKNGELALKGLNRGTFEEILIKNKLDLVVGYTVDVHLAGTCVDLDTAAAADIDLGIDGVSGDSGLQHILFRKRS